MVVSGGGCVGAWWVVCVLFLVACGMAVGVGGGVVCVVLACWARGCWVML